MRAKFYLASSLHLVYYNRYLKLNGSCPFGDDVNYNAIIFIQLICSNNNNDDDDANNDDDDFDDDRTVRWGACVIIEYNINIADAQHSSCYAKSRWLMQIAVFMSPNWMNISFNFHVNRIKFIHNYVYFLAQHRPNWMLAVFMLIGQCTTFASA